MRACARSLKLRTVIAIVPTEPTPPWETWCAAQDVRLIHVPCEIYKEKNPVNSAIASRVLEVRRRSALPPHYHRRRHVNVHPRASGHLVAQLLINTETHPVFVHCMNGAEVTGLIVMCLRKLQLWSQTFGLLEFGRCEQRRATQSPATQNNAAAGISRGLDAV